MTPDALADSILKSLERRMARRQKQRSRLEDLVIASSQKCGGAPRDVVQRYHEACAFYNEARLTYNAAVDLWNQQVAK